MIIWIEVIGEALVGRSGLCYGEGLGRGGGALLLGSPVDNGALGVPAGALGCRGGGSRSEDCWSQERDFLRNIAWIIQFFILMHTHAYVRMLIYYRCV